MRLPRSSSARRRSWLILWLLVSSVIGIGVGTSAARLHSRQQATKTLSLERDHLRGKVREQAQTTARAGTEQQTRSHEERILDMKRRMNVDLNPAFATIENLQMPGAKLQFLLIEGAEQTVRIEYEVDSVNQATLLTSTINNGASIPPWRLDGVSTRSTSGGERFRASWTARMNDLR